MLGAWDAVGMESNTLAFRCFPCDDEPHMSWSGNTVVEDQMETFISGSGITADLKKCSLNME